MQVLHKTGAQSELGDVFYLYREAIMLVCSAKKQEDYEQTLLAIAFLTKQE